MTSFVHRHTGNPDWPSSEPSLRSETCATPETQDNQALSVQGTHICSTNIQINVLIFGACARDENKDIHAQVAQWQDQGRRSDVGSFW